MAADDRRPIFRGGRQAVRDRWYGLEAQPGFAAFRRWWHRVGKEAAGGADLASREEAQAAYAEWRAAVRDDVGS